MRKRRPLKGLAFLQPAVVWWCGSSLEGWLLSHGVLNTKDMTFVGDETGTLRERLLNVWHWDAALILLLVAAVPCFVYGLVLLTVGQRERHKTGHCRRCGYDLTGNVSGRCPECGEAANRGE